MMKTIIFLGLIAAIQCQPLNQYYEDQQPIENYHPEELEAFYRERRSVEDQPIESYYPEDRERRSVQDYEPIVPEIDYHRERRSVQQNDEFNNEIIIDQHPGLYYYPREIEEIEASERHRRSLQPGAPTFPMPNVEPPTKLTPHITEQGGTTNVGAKVDHKFGKHDATVNWNKNIRGPGKAKPNWGVRGTFRF